MAAHNDQARDQQADTLYEQYGKPLEAAHSGEYVAISADGRTITGTSVLTVMEEAKHQLGTGNFIFKIGARSVGA